MNARPPDPAPSNAPIAKKVVSTIGLLVLFVLAAGSGLVCERLGLPLPWMIGPLLLTACVFLVLRPTFSVPSSLRPIGQIVVATQVGLAFSPAALGLLLQVAPVIVGTALASIACVFLVAVLTSRFSKQSLAQTFLSTVPTSPVEAAAMAVKANIDPAPVIFSQTIRLSSVVLVLPAALYTIDGWPRIERPLVSLQVSDPLSIAMLATMGVGAAALFRLLRVPNPNFLGPMTMAAFLSASGYASTAYPAIVLAGAQIVLGTWLGGTFRREIVTSALRASVVSIISALALLALCSLSGVGIALITGAQWRALVLGAAPGGAVEMALTAKFLAQNVMLITTFHLVRIFILMPNIPWIVNVIVRREKRLRTERNP